MYIFCWKKTLSISHQLFFYLKIFTIYANNSTVGILEMKLKETNTGEEIKEDDIYK